MDEKENQRLPASVYLDEAQAIELRQIAEREGRSQAEVVREAVAQYAGRSAAKPDRNFRLAGSFDGPSISIADIPDEELMKGFGDDAFSGRWASYRSAKPETILCGRRSTNVCGVN